MNCKQIHKVYFSPNGTTKEVVDAISNQWQAEQADIDLLCNPMPPETKLSADDLLVVGMPVYAGRIPTLCRELLSRFHGTKTPAVAVVVYGNREYEDALLELKELLEETGFEVIGAGAFLAQHSIFPRVAAGRPDAQDRTSMASFATACETALQDFQAGSFARFCVPGDHPYRKAASVPLKPSADKSCIRCGKCAVLCPTHSIPPEAPEETRKESCISCGACIHICPVKARAFRGLMYTVAEKEFTKKNAGYKEPEWFTGAK